MQINRTTPEALKWNFPFVVPVLWVSLLLFFPFLNAKSQDCPPNLDFEEGSFNGWSCYVGNVASVGNENQISLSPTGPMPDYHTMYTSNAGNGVDPYGGFPVNCPNGSGHSIKLGNERGGGEAEGISYQFTIPAGKDIYSLIYHYAVVFQDPNHLESQQPRMQIEILNVTDNVTIDCSSFAFHPYGTRLPGFNISSNMGGGDVPVWYKDWSAVSINLNGHAGKTIRMFFKTADCTFRRHFGYAYVDVNSECSGEFVGASYCPDDTAVNVVAPYGYESYTWFNNDLTQVIGTSQVLTLNPVPPSGTMIAVQVVPYNGYGCLDTLYAQLIDTLTVTANAGHDTVSCNLSPVQIGAMPRPGIVYRWDPPEGLSDPTASNPLASPSATTRYILTANSSGGGCPDKDTVFVQASVIDNSMQLAGSAVYCITSGDSTILRVRPSERIQWYRDGSPIAGATGVRYEAVQSGSYHALLSNSMGCKIETQKQEVLIDIPKVGITYPVEYAVYNMPLTLQAREMGVNVVWKPGVQLDNVTSYKPVFKGVSEQLYYVEITAASGCLTVDTQLVKTIERVELLVPTGFTPDRDGRNDVLRPILKGVKELYYFRVFNRAGQLLYEMKGLQQGWNGMYRGVAQHSQVVVWVASGRGVDNNVHTVKGTCVLIR